MIRCIYVQFHDSIVIHRSWFIDSDCSASSGSYWDCFWLVGFSTDTVLGSPGDERRLWAIIGDNSTFIGWTEWSWHQKCRDALRDRTSRFEWSHSINVIKLFITRKNLSMLFCQCYVCRWPTLFLSDIIYLMIFKHFKIPIILVCGWMGVISTLHLMKLWNYASHRELLLMKEGISSLLITNIMAVRQATLGTRGALSI